MASIRDVIRVTEEGFYKDLDPILDIVNTNCAMMDETIQKKYVDIILSAVDFVLEELKSTDEVFKQLYSKLEHVGSYFDGLRVTKPTELDLNLIMQMPSDYQLLIENINKRPSLVTIKVTAPNTRSHQLPDKLVRTIESWCDGSGFLLKNRVRQWMKSILTRYLGQGAKTLYLSSSRTVEVRARKSGRAFTLSINIESDVVDVDLVFTIQFPETKRPPASIRWNNDLRLSFSRFYMEKQSASWVVLSKGANNPRFWRLSFAYSERKVLHSHLKIKLVNRFIKALCDALDLQIPSYYIKTLFLWEANDCVLKNRMSFWEQSLGYLFVFMLNKLCAHLDQYPIRFYWHSYFNVSKELKRHQAVCMENQIRRIISKIIELIRSNDKERLKCYVLGLFNISDSNELSMVNLRL